MTPVQATIARLRACQQYRNAGGSVSFTMSPTWLVQMAINRRAGWPDDPSEFRGSAMPVDGKYPRKASGSRYSHLWNVARAINTPRLIVRPGELGEWRKLILARCPERIEHDA